MASSARRITVEFLGDAKGLTSAADQVERKTSTLGSKMAHVGKIAAIGLAGGLAAAGVAMVGMVKNGADDLAAQRKLAVALQNTTGATKEQVKGVENWISKQGVALGVTDDELRPAFQRLVQSTGDITKAQKLAGIAMDASAGSGKSLKTVSEAIAKAHNGNLGALSRLGVKIKDSDGKALSFNEAMKEMGKTFKGQAAAGANTFDGKMGRLKLIMDETKETIGQKLIPILTNLATWFLNNGIPMLKKFGDGFSKVTGFVKEHRNTLIGLTAAMVALVAITKVHAAVMAIEAAGGMLKYLQATKLVSAATKIYAAVQWVLNAALTANPIGIVVVALAALAGGIIYAYKHSEKFRNIVNGVFSWLGSAVKNTIDFVKNHWKLIVAILTGPIGTAAILIISNFGKIKTAASNVVNWIKDIPGKLKDLGQNFAGAGKHLIGKFVDGMKNAAGVIGGIAGNVWDAVKKLLNKAIDKINSALEFTISLPGPDIHINPANIPHLAKGGIVKARPGGTLALLGEAGQDEMVTPLGGSASRRMTPRAGGQQTVTHVLDLRLNGKTIRKMLLDEQRSIGYSIGIS